MTGEKADGPECPKSRETNLEIDFEVGRKNRDLKKRFIVESLSCRKFVLNE